jgi:hypothetical protein
LLGNEDAIQAKNSAWLKASGEDPSLSYRQFSNNFTKNFDPRVFQFKYMNQEERQKYIDKLEPNDQYRLLGNIAFAKKHGWINYLK